MLEFAHHGFVGPGAGMMWIGIVWWLIVIAAIAGAVVLVSRALSKGSTESPADRGPLRILEERFARGEIDAEEFRARRDALRS